MKKEKKEKKKEREKRKREESHHCQLQPKGEHGKVFC